MVNERTRKHSRQQRSCADGDPRMHIKEEQTSSDESHLKSKPKERRHRASVACTSCRSRRIRCVVPSGKKTCIQCERSSMTCVIKDDDERRRPISRAYVYSLVERVALLEQTLESHGLEIPPVSHPPESRHRSRRDEDTSSFESTSSFSSTPQESLMSDDQTATSPSSPDVHTKDESQVALTKKRSPDTLDIKKDGSRGNKRIRHDSLVSPSIVKTEKLVDDALHDDSPMHYEGTAMLNQASTMAPVTQRSFWPMTYDHNGGLTAVYPTISDVGFEHRAFDAWSSDAFAFHEYSGHTMVSHYDEALPSTYGIERSSSIREATTNLDFMPLS